MVQNNSNNNNNNNNNNNSFISRSENSALNNKIQFCQLIQYIFDDEPVLEKSPTIIKCFIYYNEETCDVFNDFIDEMNSNWTNFDSNNSWDNFYIRKHTPMPCLNTKNMVDVANLLL